MTHEQATELVGILKDNGWRLAHFYRANNSLHWETYHVAAAHPTADFWQEFTQPYAPGDSRAPDTFEIRMLTQTHREVQS